MKTLLNTQTARNAIKFVAAIANKRATLPILSAVHCAANGHLELTATDLDVTLRAQCPCSSQTDGATAIPAAALVDICAGNARTAIDCELVTDEKHITTIRAGGMNRQVNGFAPAEFPPMLNIPENARVHAFDAAEFIAALKAVALAESTDETRYVLNGVCVDISEEGISLVATDGRRMHIAAVKTSAQNADCIDAAITTARAAVESAQKDLAAAVELYAPIFEEVKEGKHAGYFQRVTASEVTDAEEVLGRAQDILARLTAGSQILLPAVAVKHILRLPMDKKNPGELSLCAFDLIVAQPTGGTSRHPHAAIRLGNYSIITKQIEGNYPNYRWVIPRDVKEIVPVNVAAFRAAVEIAEKATSDKSNSVRLEFTQDNLKITGKTPEVGEASADCAVTCAKGFQMAIALNPEYLLEACEAFSGSDYMNLELINELSPLKITNAAGLMAIIMPMRLS